MADEITTATQIDWNEIFKYGIPVMGTLLGGLLGFLGSYLTQKKSLKHNERMLDKKFKQENETRFHKEKLDLYSRYLTFSVERYIEITVSKGEDPVNEELSILLSGIYLVCGEKVGDAAKQLHSTLIKASTSIKENGGEISAEIQNNVDEKLQGFIDASAKEINPIE